MDKKKALDKIAKIKNSIGPSREVNDHLCDLLTEIVNEMPDREPTPDIDKINAEVDAAMSDLLQHFVKLKLDNYFGHTVTGQFCKWKEFDRRPRGFICKAKFDDGVKTFSNLSFAQAIKVLLEDNMEIRHVSWHESVKLHPYPNASGFLFWDGVSHCSYFTFTTEMLHSGWIVLDR